MAQDELEKGIGSISLGAAKGPFITQPSFWELEGGGDNPATGAPLLDRNNGFLESSEAGNKAVLERAAKFKAPTFRQQMIETLEQVADGDYHQDTAKVLHRIGTDPKYTPGYWKGQPEAFVRDAMVYMRLVETRFPEVAAHLTKASLVPEAYAQKWFVGLCVHTMPFASLIDVFESFLAEGHMFLFKLSLAIVSAVAPAILETKPAEVNKLFELLRLDKKLFPDSGPQVFADIVAAAKSMELDAQQVEQLRGEQMALLQAKLEKVRAREKELKAEDDDDEIVFSDEDEDEEDEAARLARLAGN